MVMTNKTLIPEEQQGCCIGSKGCTGQLPTSKVITEQLASFKSSHYQGKGQNGA
jgi:hypothetical protein